MTLIIVYKALYYREITNYQAKNLEILDEAIVCKIRIKRKKVYFVFVYRTPSQTVDEFNLFLDRLELTVENIQAKKPDCIIITGNFNRRTQQWWSGDIEDPHGTALDDFIQSKNLSQPKHIINDSSFCIDLIITSHPFLFVEQGIPLYYSKTVITKSFMGNSIYWSHHHQSSITSYGITIMLLFIPCMTNSGV